MKGFQNIFPQLLVNSQRIQPTVLQHNDAAQFVSISLDSKNVCSIDRYLLATIQYSLICNEQLLIKKLYIGGAVMVLNGPLWRSLAR